MNYSQPNEDMRVTLDDLTVVELRWYYRTLGGRVDTYDRDRLREMISALSAGDVPPHTPNVSGHDKA